MRAEVLNGHLDALLLATLAAGPRPSLAGVRRRGQRPARRRTATAGAGVSADRDPVADLALLR
jgi:hypothetical protein